MASWHVLYYLNRVLEKSSTRKIKGLSTTFTRPSETMIPCIWSSYYRMLLSFFHEVHGLMWVVFSEFRATENTQIYLNDQYFVYGTVDFQVGLSICTRLIASTRSLHACHSDSAFKLVQNNNAFRRHRVARARQTCNELPTSVCRIAMHPRLARLQ